MDPVGANRCWRRLTDGLRRRGEAGETCQDYRAASSRVHILSGCAAEDMQFSRTHSSMAAWLSAGSGAFLVVIGLRVLALLWRLLVCLVIPMLM